MYFIQAGKATLWTTKWEPCISVCLFLPTFYLCCKTSRSQAPEDRCSRPAAPFKNPFFILLFLYFLFLSVMLFLVFEAWLLSLLKIRGHILRSLSLYSISLSLFLLSATILGKHQHCTPVFHRNHQYKKKTVDEFIKTLAFYLVFTPVFLSHFIIKHWSICPLLNVHLLKWNLKCQKSWTMLNKGD